ncbi:MAG: FAD:protein FMN transferase [Planctomycetes bacterium]|nr:FAD:protein FMN transferase [Planctomycetota bacterium]
MLAAPAATPAEELDRFTYTQVHMGAPFRIVLYGPNREAAGKAAQAAFARIKQLDEILSDYKPQSELNRLSRSGPASRGVKVSDELWTVLSRAQALSRETDGAFDVTVGPYVRLWRRARRNKQMPSERLLAEAKASVGYRHVRLDEHRHTVQLTRAKMQLDLGGIAKGYAADEALAVLKRHGVTRALVDAGGDIALGAAPPDRKGWRIGVAPLAGADGKPSRYLVLSNVGVATSGDAHQFVEIDGRRYSHIVDPHTGLGLTVRGSVTIVAPDCITADSLASAVSVLGPQRGMKLVEARCGVEAIVMTKEGEATKRFVSTGLRSWEGSR